MEGGLRRKQGKERVEWRKGKRKTGEEDVKKGEIREQKNKSELRVRREVF